MALPRLWVVGRRDRWDLRPEAVGVGLVWMAPLIILISSAGFATGLSSSMSQVSTSTSVSSPGLAASVESAHSGVLASCSGPDGIYASAEAYDAADGYLYTENGASYPISIVKPPCDFVKYVNPPGPEFIPSGIGYDPLTKEIVVAGQNANNGDGVLTVIQGTAIVEIIELANGDCPGIGSWDPAVSAMLLADPCRGIDLLYLTEVNGVTRGAVIFGAFDGANRPGAVLVADGYIFSAGKTVDVFNDRTLASVGSFSVTDSDQHYGSPAAYFLAWDPLNDTVVLGYLFGIPREAVMFLNADSIESGKFTHSTLPLYFQGLGVDGVGYSPATEEVYFSPYSAASQCPVFELSKSGEVSRAFLGDGAEPTGLTYDPVSHDMYVSGYRVLYLIH
jgi:hypothetical protein